jgi:hypothetical protein
VLLWLAGFGALLKALVVSFGQAALPIQSWMVVYFALELSHLYPELLSLLFGTRFGACNNHTGQGCLTLCVGIILL